MDDHDDSTAAGKIEVQKICEHVINFVDETKYLSCGGRLLSILARATT